MKSLLNFICLSLLLNGCVASWENNEAARANAKLAHAYIEQAHYAEAKAKLLLATQQAPHEAFVWNGWAYYADCTGETEEADAYYHQALRLQPHWGILHNNYGVFLCRQARYPEALRQFDSAIQDPNYLYPEQAYRNAAVCAQQAGQMALAVRYEEKAKAFSPK